MSDDITNQTGDRPLRLNLYLIGFMGTGKSVIGRALAKSMDYRFIDSDHWIEETQGRTITRIFEELGEAAFREMERDFVFRGHPREGCIVACGGGLAVQAGLLEALESKGVVVALFASPETILRRVSGNRNRPLLNVKNPAAEIQRLLEVRDACYRRARIGVMTDFRGIHELRERIRQIYFQRVREIQREGDQRRVDRAG